MKREQATKEEIDAAMEIFRSAIEKRIKKHGLGKWVSPHEGLGFTMEEVHELTQAIHLNNPEETIEEFLDVAVCGFWATLSLKS